MKTSFKAITVEQSIEKIFSISVKDKFINELSRIYPDIDINLN